MYKRLSNGLVPRFKRGKAVVVFFSPSKDERTSHSLIEMIYCSLQDEKGPNEILWFICEKMAHKKLVEKRSFLKILFRMFVNYYVVKIDQSGSFPEENGGK